MKIIADENIPYAEDAFAHSGEVRTLPGREMTAESVREADILLVRSVTPVGEPLLEDSAVKFVATATIGTDHIDEDYLRRAGIGFASAPGTNANSVAEYVVAALFVTMDRLGRTLSGTSIAVVGVGNVGSRVARYAEALGMQVMLNDPPLARQTGNSSYRPLEAVIGCDIVTLHVPLTTDGEDPTYHMAGHDFLAALTDEAVLINTSRGAVADTAAVRNELDAGRIHAIFDVWENEPEIDIELMKMAEIATPHIAGYSFDGKVNATAVIYRAACDFFGIEPAWDPAIGMPPPEMSELEVDCAGRGREEVIRDAVLSIYDIRRDDDDLRTVADMPAQRRGPHFDRLRRDYPRRREFFNTELRLTGDSRDAARVLSELGFK